MHHDFTLIALYPYPLLPFPYVTILHMAPSLKNHIITYAIFGLSLFVFSIFIDQISILSRSQVALVTEFGASVTETPTNKLAAALRDKSIELDLREKALVEREMILEKERDSMQAKTRNILLTTLALSLFTLLIVNGYIYKRDKSRSQNMYQDYARSGVQIPKKSYSINLHEQTKNMA